MEEIKNSLDLVERLNDIVSYVNSSMEDLSKNISLYDLQEQDILHFIENKSVGASNMSKLIKLIKSVRNERRKCKFEYMRLQSLSAKLRNKDTCILDTKFEIKELPNYYDFKTNILESIGFVGCNPGGRMYVDDGSIKTISYSALTSDMCEVSDLKTDSTPTTEDTLVRDRTYVDGKIDETLLLEETNSDVDDDNDMDFVFEHPEGRKIIITNINTGEEMVCKNFESAVNRVLFSTKGIGHDYSKSPNLLVKNVSGIMKAIKSGNIYLGFKWEVK